MQPREVTPIVLVAFAAGLAACQVASSSSLVFACAARGECGEGYRCVDGLCIDVDAAPDAGAVRPVDDAGAPRDGGPSTLDGGDPPTADGGGADDAGFADGGVADGGGVDGGAVDGGVMDGGVLLVDAGDMADAGPAPDAGSLPPDAGCTDAHDEDQDGVGDACDNCPAVPNATQADVGEGAAADGVGDACDPRPTQGGDALLFFEPFAGAALPAGWSLVGAGVSFDADRALFDVAFGAASLVKDGPSDVALEITYGFLGTAGGDEGVAVYLRADASVDDGYCCAHFIESSTADGTQALVESSGGGLSVLDAPVAAPDPADGIGGRLRVAGFGDALACVRDGQTAVAATDGTYATGRLAISADGVRVEVLSATAWTLGGAP